MIFARLGNFVVRRYKLIILAWLVVLFFVFPLVFKIGEVVVYQETEAGLDNLEAMKAEQIIEESFPGQIAPSTIMIVLQNEDVLAPEVRTFASGLVSDLTIADLEGVSRIDYLWGTAEAYVAGFIMQTAPAMVSLVNQTDEGAQLVFGIPLQIIYNHMILLPVVGDDSIAKDMVLQGIEDQLMASGADNETVALTLGYAESFYDVWLPTHNVDDMDLLDAQVTNASMEFFAPMLPFDVAVFFLAIEDYFSVYNFSSLGEQVGFAAGIVSAETGAEEGFLGSVWSLGPEPSYEAAYGLAHQTVFSNQIDFIPVPVPMAFLSSFVNFDTEVGEPNNTMLIVVTMSVSGSSDIAGRDVRAIREIVADRLEPLGPDYEAYVTGDAAFEVDIMDAVDRDTSRIEPTTVILVVLLVGFFFRSVITPWVPLMTVGMAYLTSTALIYILGYLVMEIHYSVMTIVLVVMMGAGTDYCIFIISRYREERVLGRSKEDAVRTSLTWAGESIATSGATVMIGFGALMIGEYSLVRSMGMALVLAVGMALSFALTMLPSMIMLVGDRIFWPNTVRRSIRADKARQARGGGYFRKSAKFSLKHSKAIVVVALVAAVPAVYLTMSLETSYDFIGAMPDAESRAGMSALGEGFGQGRLMPTYAVVRYPSEVVSAGALNSSAAAELEQYCELLEQNPNVRTVKGPTRPFGDPINETFLAGLTQNELATYQMAISGALGVDDRTIMLTVILEDEPFSIRSVNTIDELRAIDDSDSTDVFGPGVEVYIGGATAGMTDVSRTVSQDFFTMRIVVIIGIYLVLMVVLGSLVIPLRLILTVLLSVVSTIAMTLIIFQVMNGVPVLWMMPLILFVVAMGLGMDYDIFLTTRIREEVAKGKTDEQAILTAVERTGGIITACGVIMAGAFGSMLLSSTALLQQFGFGLSFAILLDAMVVRIYVVPAIMLLLKKWNWYAPGRLQRVRRDNKSRKR